jgi:ATP-dependent Zn protease
MTSFYDKYYLNNTSSRSKDTNVLKTDYTLEYTDYQKLKMAEQYNKLYNEIYNKNIDNVKSKENEKIYNLSFNQLFQNAGTVYIDIINDLAIYFSDDNKDKNINKLGYIFTKNNNILYIGLFILILSFLLWLIDMTK